MTYEALGQYGWTRPFLADDGVKTLRGINSKRRDGAFVLVTITCYTVYHHRVDIVDIIMVSPKRFAIEIEDAPAISSVVASKEVQRTRAVLAPMYT